jgi:EmrB/QacA subfamily drug resistance transporter
MSASSSSTPPTMSPSRTGTASTMSPPRSGRRRWFALVVVCLGMFMNSLDASIVNVALPAIQRQLHLSQANLTWVVDAYLITFGSFLLLAGRLGDLVGRKRVFLWGIAVFTASSAMCGLAQDQVVLIAGRFLQGIGGAMSASVIIAIIVTEFPRAEERAKAMSAYIFVAVGGGSIGLLVGGVLTQSISWHWIFFINVPIGITTFVLGRILIKENRGLVDQGRVDVLGSVMVTAALLVGIYAIVKVTEYGWLSANTFLFGGVSVALLIGFVVLESRLANPIMPLRIFRLPTLARSSVVRGFLNTGMFSTFFLGALYLENVLGYSPIQTGLAFLPLSVVMGGLSAGITARLVGRFGNKRVMMPGMACAAVGLLLLTQAGPHAGYLTSLFPAYLLLGLGAGTAFMPLLSLAMHEVPAEDAGLGSGIINVSMQVAAAIGLAVLGTLAANRTTALARAGHTTTDALIGGYHLAFFVAAGCVVVGMLIAGFMLTDHGGEPAGTGSSRRLEAENATEPLAT